jgi:hypothetical protein
MRSALLLPLVIAACGGASSATTAPANATPEATAMPLPTADTGGGNGSGGGTTAMCDALTKDEVAASAGVEVTGTLSTEPGDGSSACTYSGADNTPVAAHTLITPGSPIPPLTAYDTFTSGGEAVAGIGDRAVWAMLGESEMGQLYVMVGEDLYTVAVMASAPDTAEHRKAASIELAKLAIPRLP